MLLPSCNVCNIKIWLLQQFLTYWKDNNIPNIKKETEQTETDKYSLGKITSLGGPQDVPIWSSM